MKFKTIASLAVAACLFAQAGLHAQPTNAVNTNAVDAAQIQLQQLVHQIQDKANAGQRGEADYTDELKTFDALIAGEKGAKTDEAAQIVFMKAVLYLEVFQDTKNGSAIMQQIITNYPNTQYSEKAKKIVEQVAGTPTPLQQLVQRVQAKANAGKTTEADFADDLKAFDSFIADYKGTNTQEEAKAAFYKGLLYVEIIEDFDKGTEIFKQVQAHFPTNEIGDRAAELLEETARLKSQHEALMEQTARFPAGQPPADFDEKNLDGKPISLASLKGKVVLLDFWATWCAPCVAELPNLIAAYQKHHADGLEIISVSSDDDRQQLETFIKRHDGMTWSQYFDGKGSDNKLAQKYGVHLIPFIVLLDRDGKVIAANLRGPGIEDAVAKALAAK